jgi:hypothetical protein
LFCGARLAPCSLSGLGCFRLPLGQASQAFAMIQLNAPLPRFRGICAKIRSTALLDNVFSRAREPLF